MRSPVDEQDKRRRRGLLRLLINVWQRLKGRHRRKAEDIITRNFFGRNEETQTYATTISPTSSIETATSPHFGSDNTSVETHADSPDNGENSSKTPRNSRKYFEQDKQRFEPPPIERAYSNIYSLIESMMLEEGEPIADVTFEKDHESVLSSAILSSATPLCVFDDGSVTVGGKPFLVIHKRPTMTALEEEGSSSDTSDENVSGVTKSIENETATNMMQLLNIDEIPAPARTPPVKLSKLDPLVGKLAKLPNPYKRGGVRRYIYETVEL